MRKIFLNSLMLLCMTVTAMAVEFHLVENGVAQTAIVTGVDPAPPIRRAARELAFYVEKITGAKMQIATTPIAGLKSIVLSVVPGDDALGPEGFRLTVTPDGCVIRGNTPVAVLYGIYAMLEENFGVHWLLPGAENEVVPEKSTLSLNVGETVSVPDFALRRVSFVWAAPKMDTLEWLARNRFQVVTDKIQNLPELEELGAIYFRGGHILSTIVPDSLFDTHPEYFALVKNQRIKQCDDKGRFISQPCTSNPEVIRLTIEYLDQYFKQNPRGRAQFHIGNNDVQVWCECENCQKLDPAAEKTMGRVTTRFYTFINQVATEVMRRNPEAELLGWGYQNYREPPVGIKPDERISVGLCPHQRCYRHSVGDSSCGVNEWYRQLFKGWVATGVNVYERGYQETLLSEKEYYYLPIEKVIGNDIKYYKTIGVNGYMYVVSPPDGRYGDWASSVLPQVQYEWPCLWQSLYLAGKLLWNNSADANKILDEANTLYYGPAASAMKEYRDLLTSAFTETPGHTIYGDSGVTIGACMEDPAVRDNLRNALVRAESAAANSQTALARVRQDKMFFAALWEKAFTAYSALNSDGINAVRKSGNITIDGVADENGWKQASFTSGFVRRNDDVAEVPAEYQTYGKILYDDTNLYFLIVSDEPNPGQIKLDVNTRDGAVWQDNAIEIYLADGNGGYYQYVVNANNAIYDAKLTNAQFDGQAEVKSVVGDNRITTEVRIPLAPMGFSLTPGKVMPINITRIRKLKDGTPGENSSWSNGIWNSAASFRKVAFGIPAIKNGTFVDVIPTPPNRPAIISSQWVKDWSASGGTSELIIDGTNGNRVKTSGTLYTFLILPNDSNSYTFSGELKASGRGSVRIVLSTCIRVPGDKRPFGHESKRLLGEFTLTAAPKTFQFTPLAIAPYEQGYLYFYGEGAPGMELYSLTGSCTKK